MDTKESEVSVERKRGAENWKMVRIRKLETGVQKFRRTWRRKGNVGGAAQGLRGYFLLRKGCNKLHEVAAKLGTCLRVGREHQLMASVMLLQLKLRDPKEKGSGKAPLCHPRVPG